jgi:hypothetical protein
MDETAFLVVTRYAASDMWEDTGRDRAMRRLEQAWNQLCYVLNGVILVLYGGREAYSDEVFMIFLSPSSKLLQ